MRLGPVVKQNLQTVSDIQEVVAKLASEDHDIRSISFKLGAGTYDKDFIALAVEIGRATSLRSLSIDLCSARVRSAGAAALEEAISNCCELQSIDLYMSQTMIGDYASKVLVDRV